MCWRFIYFTSFISTIIATGNNSCLLTQKLKKLSSIMVVLFNKKLSNNSTYCGGNNWMDLPTCPINDWPKDWWEF